MSTPLRLKKIEPTVFFVQEDNELRQIVNLTIVNEKEAVEANIKLKLKLETYEFEIGKVEPGEKEYQVKIPDIREQIEINFMLYVGSDLQDRARLTWNPQKHWQIYVVQESHHDLGYTDLPQNVFKEHNDFLDKVLEFCDETAEWPEESKFRYSIEQSWSILNYIKKRPKEFVQKVMKLAKEGRIEIPALFGNLVTDMCGHEELIRSLYPSFQLKRNYGVSAKTAEIDDIPGFSWGLCTILANSGVKYFAPALPRGYYGDVHPFWDESTVVPQGIPRAFHWIGPDGSKVLLWYGPGYGISSTDLLSDYSQTYEQLPKMLSEFQEKGYPFDAVRFRVQGGERDNAPPSVKFSYVAKDWNSKWSYPKIIIATNSAFFQYIERKSPDKLPTFRGELPNTDYTVGATSTARETQINRVAHEALLTAEKFSTIAATIADYPYPQESITEAYDHTLLFDEHTWGEAHPIGPAQDSNWAEKAIHAYKAAAVAQDAILKSLNKIVDKINLQKEGYHIVVFNSLGWKRTDVVTAFLREPDPCSRPMHTFYGEKGPSILVSGTALGRDIIFPPLSLLAKPFDLIDETTGQKVPIQLIEVSSPQDPTPLAASRYAMAGVDPRHGKAIVFVAEDVPSMGYKTYRIVPSERQGTFPTSIKVTDSTLENRFYKITVDPETCVVKSIYDKELGKELVDQGAPHAFNQFIARSSSTGDEHPAKASIIQKGKDGPLLGSIIVRGEGVGCPQIAQEIIIYDKIKRIDVANRILRDSTPFLEIYFAFPFQMENPKMKFEASNSVITPIEDQFPGSCTDYYAVQHWVNISNGRFGVTFSSIDAHMVELGGLWPGYVSQAHHGITPPGYGHEFLKPGELKKGHIYSYVMNNNFRTNFSPTQVGDVLFSYSITTHTGDWREGRARDFGWGVSNPLIPVFIEGKKEGSLAPIQSFCNVDKPNVMLLNMKMAEDKEGIILRLIEAEGIETSVTVIVPFVKISEAYLTNLMEENEKLLDCQQNTITVPVKAFGLATVRIKY